MNILELTEGLACLDSKEEPEGQHGCWGEMARRISGYLLDIQNGMSHEDAIQKHKAPDRGNE